MRSARPKELYQVIEIDHISKTFSGTRGRQHTHRTR